MGKLKVKFRHNAQLYVPVDVGGPLVLEIRCARCLGPPPHFLLPLEELMSYLVKL